MEGKNGLISSLLHGCSLARKLEANLLNLNTNNPQIVADQCEEIIGVFATAKDHLDALHTPNCEPVVAAMVAKLPEMAAFSGSYMQEEEKEVAQGSMELAGGSSNDFGHHQRNTKRSSRKDEEEANKQRVRVRVPVPQIGNMDVPPEDGYTWRKYGQKEILRANFPRSYYRCTYQKLYNCPAKKQVQRLDDDPSTFEILYRGEHICHKSTTTPSLPPPPSQAVQNIIGPHKPIATIDSSMNQWLLVDFPRTSAEGVNTLPAPNQELAHVSAVGSHHHGMDVADYLNQTVVDFVADVMFNAGISSSNSMEVIFPSSDDKWETKDRKD